MACGDREGPVALLGPWTVDVLTHLVPSGVRARAKALHCSRRIAGRPDKESAYPKVSSMTINSSSPRPCPHTSPETVVFHTPDGHTYSSVVCGLCGITLSSAHVN